MTLRASVSFDRHDFFLVSQKVNQGTVTPTSYNIIANDAKLTPDHIQILTYKVGVTVTFFMLHARTSTVFNGDLFCCCS